MNLRRELIALLKGEVIDNESVRDLYSRDASLFQVKPRVVVFPKDTKDIQRLVEFVNARKEEHVSLTCHSGGTDMTGGPLTESIVVDMRRHFHRIGKIENETAVTEPGVLYRDFEKETLKRRLLLPSFPASRELCTIGGMIANNAGGEKSLSYGKTEKYVKELKVVLSDGKEYRLYPMSAGELKEHLKLPGFEGDIYRKMHALLEKNYELIQAAKPNVSKNSAGYALWNVWERHFFDLTQLFTGSQGTLGIITEATFRLVPPKRHSAMVVIFLKDIRFIARITQMLLREKPESLESYDDHTLKLAVRFLPDFLRLLKAKNLLSLAWQFLPEFWMMLTRGTPKLIILAEFTGDSKQEVLKKAKRAFASLRGFGVGLRLVSEQQEARKYFAVRHESFNLLRKHVKGMRTAPFIDDIIVRPETLPEFLPALQTILSQYPQLIYTVAGHVGDGNFHIIPLMDLSRPFSGNMIAEISQKVYDLVLKFKGSITAEHNDGLIRTPFLKQMYGEKICGLFQEVKHIFDPHNIFNPGKKVNGSLQYALEHITGSK